MRKLLCIIFLSLHFFSCNTKDSTANIPHITIKADLKAAFNVQVGSYWIYRDSISGRIDSFAVRSNSFSTNNVAGNFLIDGISINVTEYNSGSTTDTSFWKINLASNYGELFWWKSQWGDEYFDFLPAFTYPFTLGALSDIGGGQGSDNHEITTDILPSFTLQGNTFINVSVTDHSYTYDTTVNYNDQLYVCSNVGYVKMRIHDNYDKIFYTWEILRWHIVK